MNPLGFARIVVGGEPSMDVGAQVAARPRASRVRVS